MPSRFLRAAAFGAAITSFPSAALHAQADGWWHHITVLADDSLHGRQTGSPGDRSAVLYIADQFKRAGLRPAGVDGYLQPVRLTSRAVDEAHSSLVIVRPDGTTEPLRLGDDVTLGMRAAHAPHVEAPVVFVGFGLTVPELQYDDLAGTDVRGKIVLLVTGGPPSIPGPLLAHYQNMRWDALRKAGAVGVLSIQNPRGTDIPWERSTLTRTMPAMSLADTGLAESGAQITASVNVARADKLLAGSGHTMAELLATADSGRQLPHFALPLTLRAELASTTETVMSDNVVGILPGRDPSLAREYVVVTAHHDHVGVAHQATGDVVYPGAMDDASGVATILETVKALTAPGQRPRRSIVFLVVTAEEKGLLGSRYYARHPTVPRAAIVADVNVDMPLPLFPLRSIIAQGLEESDLADDLRRVGRARGLRILGDPEPLRNAFTRLDQYSFVREGIPSISLKVGFDKDSPEHELVKRWRAERYHAPLDNLTQPIDRQSAADFNALFSSLVRAVGDRATRPQWNQSSFFRRFAKR
jgi:Predicted aminopeptidases